MKRICLISAVVALGLISMFGVPAVAAVAAPVHASVPSIASHALRTGAAANPATCNNYSGHFNIYYGYCGSPDKRSCAGGTSTTINPPTYVSNGCGTRVWLYEYTSHTGYTLCVNPNTSDGHLGRSYKAFWVSSNGANC